MATRELVKGMYINNRTYVLYKEDGTEFQTIREGEPFRIDNQMSSWVPVRVPRKSGRGTILVCKKGTQEFPLIHNKRGLWALTSGAARRGVFHNYREPQTEIERQLAEMSASRRIIEKVDKIDLVLKVGGKLCSHIDYKYGFGYFSDGRCHQITEPRRVHMHPNQYHIGCADSSHEERVYDATYLVYYSIDTHLNGVVYYNPLRVILTPEADEAKVVEELRRLMPHC